MKIVNLAPHTIVVRMPDGTDREFPSEGSCRCAPVSVPLPDADGIPCVKSSFGDLQGLPDPQEGTIYLVSTPAAQKAAAMGRSDVYSPDTGATAIRENGQVKAVRGFQRF